jgi:hypothetical protein
MALGKPWRLGNLLEDPVSRSAFYFAHLRYNVLQGLWHC